MVLKGFKDVQATILIDLKKPEKKLFENLDKDARWGVNRAKRENLKVKKTKDEKDLEQFYEIYKETCKWGGIFPKPLDEIKKETIFFICKKDEKIIAGAAVKKRKNTIELFLNASLHEYQKFQPNNLLYWNMLIWARRNRYKYFDLGGYQLGTKKGDKLYNINRFKERWGGKVTKTNVYSKNLFYILGRKIIRKSKTAKRVWDKLKGRPKAR